MMEIELLDEISDGDIAALDIDAVGIMILHLLDRENLEQETTILGRLRITDPSTYTRGRTLRDHEASGRLEDALDGLIESGLVKKKHIRTAEPRLILDASCHGHLDRLEYQARSRLAIPLLTSTLNSGLHEARRLFLSGRYSDAVEAAVTSVEDRVRQLSSPPKRKQTGARLMEHAFGKNGRLRSAAMDEDMCRAIASVYSGTVVMYREPLTVHRRRPLHDETTKILDQVSEALEKTLAANLLHRHLDQVEAERDSAAEASEANRLLVPPKPRIP